MLKYFNSEISHLTKQHKSSQQTIKKYFVIIKKIQPLTKMLNRSLVVKESLMFNYVQLFYELKAHCLVTLQTTEGLNTFSIIDECLMKAYEKAAP